MTSTHRRATAPSTPVQQAALLVGVVFLLVGLLGFVPGITTGYDDMTFAEHDSGAQLLGVFQVSVLHNLVHLLFGIAGVVMARAVPMARSYLVIGGLIYLALWLYGLLIDLDSAANFVPVDTADNWLHFGLGLAMVLLGLVLSRRRAER
ncbi:DUF4383 domain-containing protein [Streptomyces coeruleoprunus]|uniref:DUF4383 domain-containing protein n=1 Tax=Streptomyces coeruleoprunus TaxID=285563 RepID=A0ABV9XIQ3_9ACTN